MHAKSDKAHILSLITQDQPAREDCSAKRLALRLSQFFSEPDRLRNCSERTLPKQVFVVSLTRLVES